MNICEERAKAKLARIEDRAGKKMPEGYFHMLVDEEQTAALASALYDGRRYGNGALDG